VSVNRSTSNEFTTGHIILTDIADKAGFVGHAENRLADYAELMGVPIGQLKNEYLYLLLDEWMGAPYALGGNSKRGIDCSGFAAMVQSEIYGKSIPRISDEQAKMIKRKYENQLEEGDLVFFSFGKSKIDHVGIYLHNHKFAHASTTKGVIISNLRDPWYYKAFKRAGTVK